MHYWRELMQSNINLLKYSVYWDVKAAEPTTMELLEIKNEVMRKIGRNVLLYQQVEQILKYLVSNGKISGDVSTIKSRHESRKSAVSKKTMGTVAGDFFSEIFGEEESSDSLPEHPSAVYLSINFRIETEEQHFELRREKIASLLRIT